MNKRMGIPRGRRTLKSGVAALIPVLGMLLLLAIGSVGSVGSAFALSGEELELKVREISDQMRCPTCQAISVKDSAASFSKQIKDRVREMLIAGQSEEEIYAYFVSRYGEWILRAPKKEGVGLLLWVLPGLALVFVGGWVGFKAYQAASKTKESPEVATISEDEREQIEKDMRRFEEDF